MDRAAHAEALFRQGYNCAQAILVTYALDHGLDPGAAFKLGAPLGGGIGQRGSLCGAVSGAILVLGLARGHADPADRIGKARVHEITRRLQDRFTERCGTVICRGLLQANIATPEGRAKAKAADAFATQCPAYVRAAGEILETLLAESRPEPAAHDEV